MTAIRIIMHLYNTPTIEILESAFQKAPFKKQFAVQDILENLTYQLDYVINESNE